MGFTGTENHRLHETKVHAGGCVGNPRSKYHVLHT